jgi:hypothetical protein
MVFLHPTNFAIVFRKELGVMPAWGQVRKFYGSCNFVCFGP